MQFSLDQLKYAKRPLILAGHGIRVAKEVERFRSLISEMNIPVVTTQLARDLMPYEHRLYVGSPGVKGDRSGGFAVQNCDVLLIIGCSLHSTTIGYEHNLFAPNACKIWVELDDAVRAKHEFIDIEVPFSIQEFLNYLQENMIHIESSEWHAQCQKWKKDYDIRKEPRQKSETMDYYDVIHTLSDLASDTETIVSDAGSAFYIVGQAWRTKSNQKVILPGGLAQMGYATSASIGCSFGGAKRVLCITGDGSLQTNIHDLAVIRHHDLNVKVIVLNNNGYACIRNTQDQYFGGFHSGTDSSTGVSFPGLFDIGMAYKIPYRRITSQKKLIEELKEPLDYKGPCLIEIMVNPKQEFIPRVQSEMVDGKMVSGSLDRMYPYLHASSGAHP